MVIKLKVQGSGPRETSAVGRIIVRKLMNNATRWRFEARLLGRYRVARHIGSQSIEEAWVEVKEAVLRSAVEVCGVSKVRGKRHRSAWWSKEVQDAVRAKKLAYNRMLSQDTIETSQAYKDAKKEARNSIRKAKNEEWLRLGEEMERDAKRSQRSFWSKVRPKEREITKHMKDWDGKIIYGEEEVMRRWKEYFDGLLNGDAGMGRRPEKA